MLLYTTMSNPSSSFSQENFPLSEKENPLSEKENPLSRVNSSISRTKKFELPFHLLGGRIDAFRKMEGLTPNEEKILLRLLEDISLFYYTYPGKIFSLKPFVYITGVDKIQTRVLHARIFLEKENLLRCVKQREIDESIRSLDLFQEELGDHLHRLNVWQEVFCYNIQLENDVHTVQESVSNIEAHIREISLFLDKTYLQSDSLILFSEEVKLLKEMSDEMLLSREKIIALLTECPNIIYV